MAGINKLSGVGFNMGRASFIDSFLGSIKTEFIVEGEEGSEFTPNLSNLRISGSIGVGRGSSTIDISASEIPDILDVMDSFNADRVLTTAEIVARTIHFDPETNSMVFKTSLAKHSREARVPKEDWNAFRDMLHDLHKKSPALLDRYIDLYLERQKSAATETPATETPATETPATE